MLLVTRRGKGWLMHHIRSLVVERKAVLVCIRDRELKAEIESQLPDSVDIVDRFDGARNYDALVLVQPDLDEALAAYRALTKSDALDVIILEAPPGLLDVIWSEEVRVSEEVLSNVE